jgi:AbrB family looped-hinge helix DNA binding protein
MSEAKVSTKGQIVIPKDIRRKMGLKPGDKVKIEILEGKKAIIQPIVNPPDDVFVKATDEIVKDAFRKADEQDDKKIRRLLRSLGVQD